MATPNYNLPTISGNMAADVVRDMNALAEASDSAIKTVDTKLTEFTSDVTASTKWLGKVGGTANALTANFAGITAYKDGMGVSFVATANSTSAVTLNINGIGAIPIKKSNGTAFSVMKNGGVYTARYSAGAFILQGEGGSGNAQPSDVLVGKTFTNDVGEFVGTLVEKKNLGIKSIQRGIKSMFDTTEIFDIPINTVISGQSIVRLTIRSNWQDATVSFVYGSLNGSNNTLRLVRGKGHNSAVVIVLWEVIEFESYVKVQSGLTSIEKGAQTVITNISTYNDSNSQVFHSYCYIPNPYTTGSVEKMVSFEKIGGIVNGTRSQLEFAIGASMPSEHKIYIVYYLVEYPS
ncbi:hypothetical protein [Lysinibacillus xylanilyticus]|uniref:hypothetical protein n=1 Tax=Lysinibacillus xylanilyticus TaxID=582475 RepID=UPI003D01B4E3